MKCGELHYSWDSLCFPNFCAFEVRYSHCILVNVSSFSKLTLSRAGSGSTCYKLMDSVDGVAIILSFFRMHACRPGPPYCREEILESQASRASLVTGIAFDPCSFFGRARTISALCTLLCLLLCSSNHQPQLHPLSYLSC